MFDRTRSLSLHLFEHVHGDSRDRGQAMVDLASLYESHGFVIDRSELPDYLPLFLEFLSQIEAGEAVELLGEASHVVAGLARRLAERATFYADVMAGVAAVAALNGEPTGEAILATPPSDESVDAAWAEAAVEFGAGSALACDGWSAPRCDG